jgi:hypothetical protein
VKRSPVAVAASIALALAMSARANAAAAPDPAAAPQPATAASPDATAPAPDPAAAPDPQPAPAPAPEAAPTRDPSPPTAAPRSTQGLVEPAAKPAARREDTGTPKLTKVEQAGWWTLFGAFVLATTGGVLGGLAEREEDRATRLAVRVDETGTDIRYADVQSEYEQALDRGEAYAKTGIVLAAMAGAAAVAGVLIFAIDAAKRKKSRARRAKLSAAGVEVRF